MVYHRTTLHIEKGKPEECRLHRKIWEQRREYGENVMKTAIYIDVLLKNQLGTECTPAFETDLLKPAVPTGLIVTTTLTPSDLIKATQNPFQSNESSDLSTTCASPT